MTEAECVSTTIYESNHPINHLPLTPLSSSRPNLHSFNDTISFLRPLKRARMRARAEPFEWVRAGRGSEKDKSWRNQDKESKNARQREESYSHESHLLFSGCHLWYMPLRQLGLTNRTCSKFCCAYLSTRTKANVRKRRFKVPKSD